MVIVNIHSIASGRSQVKWCNLLRSRVRCATVEWQTRNMYLWVRWSCVECIESGVRAMCVHLTQAYATIHNRYKATNSNASSLRFWYRLEYNCRVVCLLMISSIIEHEECIECLVYYCYLFAFMGTRLDGIGWCCIGWARLGNKFLRLDYTNYLDELYFYNSFICLVAWMRRFVRSPRASTTLLRARTP